uniref:DUF1907 domain-containing protein n=1 Tax=Acrobeloides nanus TaxID=290746 RepID=A0A914C3J3_9BILA
MKDFSTQLSQKLHTFVPKLNELKKILERELKKNFQDVTIEIVPCPNLKEAPFNMTGAGIGDHLRIAEIGGLGNLYPEIEKEKFYDLKQICTECELPKAFIFGPGAGPWHVVGKNSECVADANFTEEPPKVNMHIMKLDDENFPEAQNIDIPNMCLMANLAVSDGAPKKDILKIEAKIRTNESNFPETIRRALAEHYPGQLVSMCGVFILKKGTAKFHIMQDFPHRPWNSREEKNTDFLKFFEMNAPIVCTTVFHSYDPGLSLRLEHTHCFSEHGDGGHYHHDTTPDIVEYEGYFLPADQLYRIDQVENP